MRSKSKIKIRSISHFQVNQIYNKLEVSFTKKRWYKLIDCELNLNQIINELSKADFEIGNQSKLRLSIRQTFKIKKQIIKLLSQNDITLAILKLKQLLEKITTVNEKNRIYFVIVFLEGKLLLKQNKSTEVQCINWFKQKLNDYLTNIDLNPIKIKLMTIVSIFLLNVNGILMSSQQKSLISKTIENKKKILRLLDNIKQKEIQLESLLYILLEFYKILFLLKKDIQLINLLYIELEAFSRIYNKPYSENSYFDSKDIEKVLKQMKPILYELNIYQDSHLLKEFAFKHAQHQISHHDAHPSAKDYNRKRQSISSKLQSKKSLVNSTKKLILVNRLSLKSDVDEQLNKSVLKIVPDQGLTIPFLKLLYDKLYIFQLQMSIKNNYTEMDLSLTLKTNNKLQIYKLSRIETQLDKINLMHLSRLIEKIIIKLFHNEAQFKELHNLNIAEEYVPKEIDRDFIIVTFIRCKNFIKEYAKRYYDFQSCINNVLRYPNISAQSVRNAIEEENREKDKEKKEKGIFLKRKGMFEKEYLPQPEPQHITSIKCFIKKENRYFYFFNIIFEECFKGLYIQYMTDNKCDLNEYINIFKDTTKLIVNRNTMSPKIIRKEVLTKVLTESLNYSKVQCQVLNYKLEEEIQMTAQHKIADIPIESKIIIQKPKLKKRQQKQYNKKYTVFKTNSSYQLLIEEIVFDCYKYSSENYNFILPLRWKQEGYVLEKCRVRMYNCIHIFSNDQVVNKTIIQNQRVMKKQQKIILKLKRYKIKRKKQGYCILNEYQAPNSMCLYQVVLNKQKIYFYIGNRFEDLGIVHLDLQAMKINSKPLILYSSERCAISEANNFYLNTIEHKN